MGKVRLARPSILVLLMKWRKLLVLCCTIFSQPCSPSSLSVATFIWHWKRRKPSVRMPTTSCSTRISQGATLPANSSGGTITHGFKNKVTCFGLGTIQTGSRLGLARRRTPVTARTDSYPTYAHSASERHAVILTADAPETGDHGCNTYLRRSCGCAQEIE